MFLAMASFLGQFESKAWAVLLVQTFSVGVPLGYFLAKVLIRSWLISYFQCKVLIVETLDAKY